MNGYENIKSKENDSHEDNNQDKKEGCNVYITINCCCKEEKYRGCGHVSKSCDDCNVYITVNCCEEEEKRRA